MGDRKRQEWPGDPVGHEKVLHEREQAHMKAEEKRRAAEAAAREAADAQSTVKKPAAKKGE